MTRRKGGQPGRETRGEGKARWRRVHSTLDEVARELSLRKKRKRGLARGGYAGGRVTVIYDTGSGDVSLPADRHRFNVTFKRRWTDARVTIVRGRPLSTDRRMQRFQKQLTRLPPAAQEIVVEALTEIDGPIRLTRTAMTSNLLPKASAGDIVDRVRAMVDYIDRLQRSA